MRYLRHYPVSLAVVAVICYLSFFTPPETSLNEVPYIDKVVHICMYGGLSTLLWTEYLFHHRIIRPKRLVIGAILCPILMSGCIEILQSTCTENRSGDWMDFAANCTGVFLASLLGHYVWQPLFSKHFRKK